MRVITAVKIQHIMIRLYFLRGFEGDAAGHTCAAAVGAVAHDLITPRWLHLIHQPDYVLTQQVVDGQRDAVRHGRHIGVRRRALNLKSVGKDLVSLKAREISWTSCFWCPSKKRVSLR